MARLIASAKSFANVKPLEPIEGDSPEALVSRIEFAAKSGALRDIEALWQQLPVGAQAKSSDWMKKVQARLTAEQLLNRPVQDYLTN